MIIATLKKQCISFLEKKSLYQKIEKYTIIYNFEGNLSEKRNKNIHPCKFSTLDAYFLPP